MYWILKSDTKLLRCPSFAAWVTALQASGHRGLGTDDNKIVSHS